jgi:hypothetical protein
MTQPTTEVLQESPRGAKRPFFRASADCDGKARKVKLGDSLLEGQQFSFNLRLFQNFSDEL